MISVEEAKQLVLTEAANFKKRKELLPLIKAAGLVLAKEINATTFSPPFHQSAMDGYALCFADAQKHSGELTLAGEIKAGDVAKKFKKNTAIRIFTGASIPQGADTVVQQEHVTSSSDGKKILFNIQSYTQGQNVRLKGSQFAKGETVVQKDITLNAAGISVAAMAGHVAATVYAPLAVSVVVTGNELAKPGAQLKPGEIYESNSIMLQYLLQQNGIATKKTYFAKDRQNQLIKTITDSLKQSDVVLISGGISVGKYDLVKDVLGAIGFKTIFHKVKQKPGKPLYFGKKGKQYVFGLPGNPAASMTCFYEYVLPFLKITAGHTITSQSKTSVLPLADTYLKKAGLTHFLKGKIQAGQAYVLPDQESYKLTSFTEANCIIQIPENSERTEKGSPVICNLI